MKDFRWGGESSDTLETCSKTDNMRRRLLKDSGNILGIFGWRMNKREEERKRRKRLRIEGLQRKAGSRIYPIFEEK